LILVGDGSIPVPALEDAVRFYAAPVRVIDYAELRRQAEAEGFSELVEYGERHVLGRKLLAILSLAAAQPVLWCDSDVLWFRTLSVESIAQLRRRSVTLTEDCACAYDPNVAALAPGLRREPPYFNSGLVLVSEDVRANPLVRAMAAAAAKQPAWHSEQTVLAALAASQGPPGWGQNEVYITIPQFHQRRLLPGSPSYQGQAWLARHYVMAREQFWRDAAALCRRYARTEAAP
jgi:hypothetical protein